MIGSDLGAAKQGEFGRRALWRLVQLAVLCPAIAAGWRGRGGVPTRRKRSLRLQLLRLPRQPSGRLRSRLPFCPNSRLPFMVRLYRAELTDTGRPVLLHGEVERGMLDKVRGGGGTGGGAVAEEPKAALPAAFYALHHFPPLSQVDVVFGTVAGGVPEHPAEEYRVGAACCSTRCAAALASAAQCPFAAVCARTRPVQIACRRLYILHPPTGGLHSAHQLPTHLDRRRHRQRRQRPCRRARRAVPPAAAGGVCCGAQVGAAAKGALEACSEGGRRQLPHTRHAKGDIWKEGAGRGGRRQLARRPCPLCMLTSAGNAAPGCKELSGCMLTLPSATLHSPCSTCRSHAPPPHRHPAEPRSVACILPLKLVCHGPSPETLHSQLLAALERRAWAAAPQGLLQQLHPAPAPAGGLAPGRVGPRPPGERPAAGAAFQPDRAIVGGLCAIGYPRLHAVNAAAATRNAGARLASSGQRGGPTECSLLVCCRGRGSVQRQDACKAALPLPSCLVAHAGFPLPLHQPCRSAASGGVVVRSRRVPCPGPAQPLRGRLWRQRRRLHRRHAAQQQQQQRGAGRRRQLF